MSNNSPKRWNIWTPLLAFSLLSIGIFLGFHLNKPLEPKRPITTIIERYDRIEEIINIIGERFVDSVSKDSLYIDAINGVLHHLDPHTIYIPASDMAKVSQGLDGNFKGIGVEFFMIQDTLIFTSIISNSPAEEAGLKVGDRLIKIDNEIVAGKNISSDSIIGKMKGVEDSEVILELLRGDNENDIVKKVKRGIVPLYSLDASFMINSKLGYIKINRFSATTYREFTTALESLMDIGMERLILDLRQNPGGYLDAAIAIADEFINNEKLIVFTEGRYYPRQEFTAEQKGMFEKGKLAILIDEGSASASEVIAGAVQDWDRGIIIGRRSFGKGLVQEQYNLTDGAALRLTVSKYFTPTGRDIQRPYVKGKSVAESGYFNTYKDEIKDENSIDQPVTEDTLKYFTKNQNRIVYGGGGIKPDIIVPFEERVEYTGFLYDLLVSNLLKETAYSYFIHNPEDFKEYSSMEDFNKNYKIPEALLNQLQINYNIRNLNNAISKWPNQGTKIYLAHRLKGIYSRMLYGTNGYFYFLHKSDNTVKKAIEVIEGSEYSNIIKR